ncbi:MAG: hypothetical protein CVT64_11210 [Actinobacteria bacterium HGW-Actinobacteria-4]|nr:MAG: hypothetical protein CVT64_11210 [Actinobacteria bacterium HGW-Actinobacteria-4]
MNTTDKRLNMRISEDNRELLRDAAQAQGQDLTSFVLGAALDRARSVLVQYSVTRLSREEAANLDAALAREPEAIPAIVELLRLAEDSSLITRAAPRA